MSKYELLSQYNKIINTTNNKIKIYTNLLTMYEFLLQNTIQNCEIAITNLNKKNIIS